MFSIEPRAHIALAQSVLVRPTHTQSEIATQYNRKWKLPEWAWSTRNSSAKYMGRQQQRPQRARFANHMELPAKIDDYPFCFVWLKRLTLGSGRFQCAHRHLSDVAVRAVEFSDYFVLRDRFVDWPIEIESVYTHTHTHRLDPLLLYVHSAWPCITVWFMRFVIACGGPLV